ncbi:MAG: GLUG motif-containing protein, partial [Bacteroidaceae bacterium]|nr:GLUG motif-containing protein [Bacteroidaceae bacterium]
MVRNDTNYYNKYFQFQNNISFTDSSIYYNPIGDSNSNCFSGNIDGNGKIISNLTISKNDSVGLFGCISGATIQSLGIAKRCSFTSRVYGGSLAGYASNSTIDKCFSMASLTGNATNSKIGGLIGYINGTSINNCYTINSITNSSSQSFSGGLVCLMDNNSTISNSYSSPSSFPTNGTRGILVGSITNCSNPSSNSYYDSTLNVSGMTILGISQTISQMITLDFAMDLNACQTNVWEWANGNTSLNNGLPMFNWENIGTVLPLCGSSAYPFRIRCVADLITLSNNVAGGTDYLNQFLLVENDIDFNNDPTGNSSGFTPIGNTTKSFRGNFNGGGHVISNLTKNSGNYLGLFGYISGATISNLGIEGGSLTTSQYGGALVAYAVNSVIQECYSALTTIQPSSNNLTYGGLVGYSSGCQILNCYSRTRLSSSNNNPTGAGGLVGRITNFSSVSNSYASPLQALSGNGTRGLLVGNNRNTNNSINSTITNSYFDNTLSANGYNGLGTAKTSPKMKTGCFPTYLNNGQDPIIWFKAKSQSVSGITGGVNQGYPVLSWQKLSDGITPAGFEGNCLGYDTTFVGSSSSPYRVRYVKDLIYISNMVANDTTYNENGEKKFFQMQNDISFIKYNNVSSVLVDSSSLYKPIGDFSNNKPFSGNFNGLRNAIANYSFLDTTNNNIGFFGYTNLATIQRLGISNINICAKDTVGGLVANADRTKIG